MSCFKQLGKEIVTLRCDFRWKSPQSELTQMVNIAQIYRNFVCDFFVDGWLLLWCEEVLAIILLGVCGRKFIFGAEITLKWCRDKKPTSPIKLLMLLGDVLLIEKGWTLVLWQTTTASKSYSS